MITAVVLTNRRLWSPTSMLLLSLVAYDAVFLLASIPISVTGLFIKRDPMTFTTILGVFYPLRYMAHMGSIYTTVTVTVERFLVVLVPLKARIFCTFGKTRKILLGVFAFSVAFNIPRCFFQPLFRATDPPTTAAAPNDQSAYYFWLYFRVYELYMSGVLFYLLPYALIPILNLQLLLAIKKRRSETRMMQVKNEHQPNYPRSTDLEDGVTMIVLGITACFFICCLIPAIYTMTQVAEMPDTNVFASFLIIASDTMLCINASTDFFFYCLLGRKFRNIFIRLFCPKRYIQKSRTMTSLNHSYYRHNRANSETCYHSV
ncbi:unnamed protein product [Lymnaea stagnalis]|uniref:G-protein coupled receptors family 1 profile domain-containing protein n=1 Tax=Lymnaea stagnalis TaxID=6523 RepID=A0AAV2I8G9_LYMST